MRGALLLAVGSAVLLAGLPPPSARADEAVLRDGRRQQGTLALADGRLRFTPSGDQKPLPFGDIHAIRFSINPSPPLIAVMAHRITLPGGQQVTGELLGLAEERLRLRTAN